MNQLEIRDMVREQLQKEASNGIYMVIPENGRVVICTRDILIDESFLPRLVGFVSALKSFGEVTVEDHSDPNQADDGSYLSLVITPRAQG